MNKMNINEYFIAAIDISDKKLLTSTKGFPVTSDSAHCLFLNNEKHLSIVS